MNSDAGVATSVDPVRLSHAERLALLEQLAAQECALQALRARTLAAIEAADSSDKHWDREEVAAVLRLSSGTARSHMVEAAHLVTGLPSTLAAVESGSLSWQHSRALVEATMSLPPETATEVEAYALARVVDGRARTAAQFRAVVARAVAVCDPRRFEVRHAEAVAARQVTFRGNVADGTTDLFATGLPAHEAAQLRETLDAAARAGRLLPDGTPDPRPTDQRRADALLDLARGGHSVAATPTVSAAADGSVSPGPAASGAAVSVVVSASTLLGIDDLPGWLDGHGPIPAAMARAIAEDPDGTWRRVLTDPAGNPTEVSTAYRPPGVIARYVRARDRTCRFPGCLRRAVSCELDHVQPWPTGPTAPDNLIPLCARHHHLKHEAAGWTIHRLDNGTTRWLTPTGRVLDVPPEPYDDVPTAWLAPNEPGLDRIAPVGGYYPDEPPPPPLTEPPDLDEFDDAA